MLKHIILKIFAFFTVIILIVYFLYKQYYDSNYGQVITIYSDTTPTKIKPKDAGGVSLPNTNNIIYENLQAQKKTPKNIILLAEPEKPLNILNQKQQNGDTTDVIDTILTDIIEVNDIKAEKVKPHNNKQEVEIAAQDIFSAQQQATIATNQRPNHNKSSLNIVKVTDKKNKTYLTEPKGAYKQGLYKVQLASVKSAPEANFEGERIAKKFPKILGNAQISIKKVQYDRGKFFYMVLAGNYNTLSQAKTVCKKLSNNQQNCIITSK